MIELIVVVMVLGSLWLAGSLVLLMFKLVFGLVGGLFSLFAALIALFVGGLVTLALLPVFALALIPMLMPLLLIGGLVWLIVRAANRPQAQPQPVASQNLPR